MPEKKSIDRVFCNFITRKSYIRIYYNLPPETMEQNERASFGNIVYIILCNADRVGIK